MKKPYKALMKNTIGESKAVFLLTQLLCFSQKISQTSVISYMNKILVIQHRQKVSRHYPDNVR